MKVSDTVTYLKSYNWRPDGRVPREKIKATDEL
jgi:hypothetical protein